MVNGLPTPYGSSYRTPRYSLCAYYLYIGFILVYFAVSAISGFIQKYSQLAKR